MKIKQGYFRVNKEDKNSRAYILDVICVCSPKDVLIKTQGKAMSEDCGHYGYVLSDTV